MTDSRKRRRHRAWVFTLNNPTEQEEERLKKEFSEKNIYSKYVYQKEKGEKETEHFQGYFQLKNAKTLTAMKKRLGNRVHLEEAKGNQRQNFEYCTKMTGRIDGPWQGGDWTILQGTRTDLVAFKNEIIAGRDDWWLLNNMPEMYFRYSKMVPECRRIIMEKIEKEKVREFGLKEKEVIVYHGPTGTGKTHRVYAQEKFEDIYVVEHGTGSKDSLWFDGYVGQSVALFDDFYGWVKWGTLLRLLDKYPCKVQGKGKEAIPWLVSKIYFTSNKPPTCWYKNHDPAPLLRRITHEEMMCEKYEEKPAEEQVQVQEKEQEQEQEQENEKEIEINIPSDGEEWNLDNFSDFAFDNWKEKHDFDF